MRLALFILGLFKLSAFGVAMHFATGPERVWLWWVGLVVFFLIELATTALDAAIAVDMDREP